MKKLILLTFVLFNTYAVAQVCEPDQQYADETAGVYPLPDSVGSDISSLDSAFIDLPYSMVMTAIVPDSVEFELNPGDSTSLNTFDLAKVILDTIIGLPPGLTYTCEPENCEFPDQVSGCVLISGTPTTIGTYSMIVETRVDVGLGTVLIPITFPGDIFPGEYKIFVDEQEEVSVHTPTGSAVGLGQNVPNPFSTSTTITINTRQSGEFDFKVYNLLGKEVYREKLSLSAGNNTYIFKGNQLHSGLYFYTIGQQGNNIATKRMVIHRP